MQIIEADYSAGADRVAVAALTSRRFWRGILGGPLGDLGGEKDFAICEAARQEVTHLGYRRQNDQVGPQKPVKGGGAGLGIQHNAILHMPVD